MRTNGDSQMVFEEIMLGDPPPLRLEQIRVPTSRVRLDSGNPRLRYQQQLHPDKKLDELLFNEQDTRHLKEDIRKNGLIDPPYLRRDEDGDYTAIEGNRRTACMLRLHSEYPEDPKFATIYARVLPAHTSPQKQALLMASFHVAGKLKWNAHEKAGHIYELHTRLGATMDTLKTLLHMGEPAIKQSIAAYEMLVDRFAKIDGGAYRSQADGKWSYFAELFKIKPLRMRVMPDSDGAVPQPLWADNFCRWVGTGRLPHAEDVRKLPLILSNQKARDIFENERDTETAFAHALEVAGQSDPAQKSKFLKAVKEMIAAGKVANMNDFMVIAENPVGARQLDEARALLDKISKQAANAA